MSKIGLPSSRPDQRPRWGWGERSVTVIMLAAAAALGVVSVRGSSPPSPKETDSIATPLPNGTPGSVKFKVTLHEADGESGTITKAVRDLAQSEGLPEGEARDNGVTADAQEFVDQLEQNNVPMGSGAGGEVASPTTFVVYTTHPITHEDALQADPTATFDKIG